jgi:hypothetical protein
MSFSTRTFSGNVKGGGSGPPGGGWADPADDHASKRDGNNHRVVRLMGLVLPVQERGKDAVDVWINSERSCIDREPVVNSLINSLEEVGEGSPPILLTTQDQHRIDVSLPLFTIPAALNDDHSPIRNLGILGVIRINQGR